MATDPPRRRFKWEEEMDNEPQPESRPRPIPKTTSSWRDQIHNDEPPVAPAPTPKTTSSWRDQVHSDDHPAATAPVQEAPRRRYKWEDEMDEKHQPTVTEVDRAYDSGDNDKADGNSDGAVQSQGMNKAKWLACVALGLAFTTSYQQNACTSAIVKHIDTELGPTTYYNWIISAYSIAVSVSLPLSGGLSDIFGRKGFFIVGCFISLTGTVVALAAKNVPTIIAGMILKGIGSGSQQLALAAIAEIVPNKHRGTAQAVLDLVTLPWAIFGPLAGNAMVKYSSLSFRINFIIGVILNLLSITAIKFWYHPPGGSLAPGESKMGRLRQLDWVGVFLMAVGIVLTLMGLAFGGTQFPWGSGGVIAPLMIGIISLGAFGFWEWKVAAAPFFAHELFVGKSRTFTIQLLLTFVSGMSLYTAAAFWTQQCQGMFVKDPIKIGVSAIPGGVGGAVGGFLGGILVGKGRFLKTNLILTYGASIKLISDIVFTTLTPSKFSLALGMGFLGMFGMGLSLVALIVAVQLASSDTHIGLATLVLGSIRAIGGSVAVTIYTSIMQNTLKKDAGPRVFAATAKFGIQRETLAKFVPLMMGGRIKDALRLPGVTNEAVQAAGDALKWSYTLVFQRIYYTAIVFSVIAVIASFFVKDVSDKMTNSVAVTLKNDDQMPEKGSKVVHV